MTNKEIYTTAMAQSAADLCCKAEDFTAGKPVCVISRESERARKYLELPFFLDLVSYGTNVVASVCGEFRDDAEKFIATREPCRCFETPDIHLLGNALKSHGMKVCFMAEYFLPDMRVFRKRECVLETRVLTQEDFIDLYREEWSNALCEKRRELDVLGVGAYDKGKLVGLAGCSADCEEMWQIGVDVLPEYRNRGIASALTSSLCAEILERGKVPFYCAAWSNVRSVRNAIASGFRPAWVELTAKSGEFIAAMH